MLRALLFMLVTICHAQLGSAQMDSLHISPDPAQPQCPRNRVTYSISPWISACPASVKIVGGEKLEQHVEDSALIVSVFWEWPLDSMPGRIALTWGDSTCGDTIHSRVWNIPLLELSSAKPVVQGTTHAYYLGQAITIPLTATLAPYPDSAIMPTSFQWRYAPGGSGNIYSDGNANFGTVILSLTSYDTSYCVQVRGRFPCGNHSDWADYCLQGIIPAPCPLQLAQRTLICGDTMETLVFSLSAVLPDVSPYEPPVYTWMVPPGWTIIGNNPDTSNQLLIKPDGHTNGIISAFFTTNGLTSEACNYSAIYLPADPATTVLGPDFVCQSGEFRLKIPAPAHSAITWQVTPLDPITPPAFLFDHGSGEATIQVSDPNVSGSFRITYTIANTCGTATASKIFFVGKPIFLHPTVDGAAYPTQPLCSGGHGIKTEVAGVDASPVHWLASPGLVGYTQRDSFVFFFPPAKEGTCGTVTASVENICGLSTLPLEICAQPGCEGDLPIDLLVYPNPADIIVSLVPTSADVTTEGYALIENIEVFNHLGQLVRHWHEPASRRIVKAVADLPDGLYLLRATVWDQIIIKPLVIHH